MTHFTDVAPIDIEILEGVRDGLLGEDAISLMTLRRIYLLQMTGFIGEGSLTQKGEEVLESLDNFRQILKKKNANRKTN